MGHPEIEEIEGPPPPCPPPLPPPPLHTQWSGVAFFAAAAVASVSIIASYLGLLFGAGAGATYATLSMVAAAQQQRLEGGTAQRRRINYDREHYE